MDNMLEQVGDVVPCEHDSGSDKEELLSNAGDDDDDDDEYHDDSDINDGDCDVAEVASANASPDDAHVEPSELSANPTDACATSAPGTVLSHTSARGSKRKREEHHIAADVEVAGLVHVLQPTMAIYPTHLRLSLTTKASTNPRNTYMPIWRFHRLCPPEFAGPARRHKHAQTHRWGEFLFTYSESKSGVARWQVTCPYHCSATNRTTKCTRSRIAKSPDTLLMLRQWALQWDSALPIGSEKDAHQSLPDADNLDMDQAREQMVHAPSSKPTLKLKLLKAFFTHCQRVREAYTVFSHSTHKAALKQLRNQKREAQGLPPMVSDEEHSTSTGEDSSDST
eukprot:6481663-Amphidinium_carterae.1